MIINNVIILKQIRGDKLLFPYIADASEWQRKIDKDRILINRQ
jgi:hypothetical protein